MKGSTGVLFALFLICCAGAAMEVKGSEGLALSAQALASSQASGSGLASSAPLDAHALALGVWTMGGGGGSMDYGSRRHYGFSLTQRAGHPLCHKHIFAFHPTYAEQDSPKCVLVLAITENARETGDDLCKLGNLLCNDAPAERPWLSRLLRLSRGLSRGLSRPQQPQQPQQRYSVSVTPDVGRKAAVLCLDVADGDIPRRVHMHDLGALGALGEIEVILNMPGTAELEVLAISPNFEGTAVAVAVTIGNNNKPFAVAKSLCEFGALLYENAPQTKGPVLQGLNQKAGIRISVGLCSLVLIFSVWMSLFFWRLKKQRKTSENKPFSD